MSTNTYLQDAKSLMLELGVISETAANDCEHNVDDACYLLSDITTFITSNPEVLEAMRAAAAKKASSATEIMLEQEFMIDQNFGYPDLLSFGSDKDTSFSTESIGDNYTLIFVESESLGLEKTRIGVQSGSNYYANEKLINELNNRFH